jgi:hypothetical protein
LFRTSCKDEVVGNFVSDVLNLLPPPSIYGENVVGLRRVLDEEKAETIDL